MRTIGFSGEIVTLLPLGARPVRLVNGHIVTALPAFSAEVPLLGDLVRVELPHDQLTGWRLSHRASGASNDNTI